MMIIGPFRGASPLSARDYFFRPYLPFWLKPLRCKGPTRLEVCQSPLLDVTSSGNIAPCPWAWKEPLVHARRRQGPAEKFARQRHQHLDRRPRFAPGVCRADLALLSEPLAALKLSRTRAAAQEGERAARSPCGGRRPAPPVCPEELQLAKLEEELQAGCSKDRGLQCCRGCRGGYTCGHTWGLGVSCQ